MTKVKKETKKVLRIWSRFDCPADHGDYEFLQNAVKTATEIAIEKNTEVKIELAEVEKNGNSIKGSIVAIIRGSKFNEFGEIKLEKKGGEK